MMTQQLISTAMSYEQYIQLLETLLKEGKTTGPLQNDEYLNYGKVNLQRMHRLHKTLVLSPELTQAMAGLKEDYIWLVITEGWCGDASQNLPYLHALSKLNAHVQLRLILRDEHTEVIDRYLTNGARAIPKLICLKQADLKEQFVWGPRPALLQDMVMELKKKNVSKEEKGLTTQKWYNSDAGKELQLELLKLVKAHMH